MKNYHRMGSDRMLNAPLHYFSKPAYFLGRMMGLGHVRGEKKMEGKSSATLKKRKDAYPFRGSLLVFLCSRAGDRLSNALVA